LGIGQPQGFAPTDRPKAVDCKSVIMDLLVQFRRPEPMKALHGVWPMEPMIIG